MSIEVAVIGYGYWGRKLARNFGAADSLNLAAVCDRIRARADEARKDYPKVRVGTEPISILRDPTIDAVALSTPISTHYALARESLLHGKHVLVEKPLAMRLEEAMDLHELSRELGKVLMVDDTFLYSGKVRAIRERVEQGDLGDLYYIDAVRVNLNELRPMNRSTGFYRDAGVLWDLAIHDVAIMTSLVGAEPVRVSAHGSSPVPYRPGSPAEMAWAHLRFANGVEGHLHVNWLAPVPVKRMVIAGSRKMIVYDDRDRDRPVVAYDKGVELHPSSDDAGEAVVRYREAGEESLSWDTSEPLRKVVEHFRDSIIEKTEPLSGTTFEMKVVAVLEAMERSIALGGSPVEVPSLRAGRS